MTLPHALLTALLEHPCSGSELAGRFDRSIGYFWQATHQQIYRELARLEGAGWIDGSAVEGARGRKRVYKVLPAGRAELERWLATPQSPDPVRQNLMVRLRAEAVVGPTDLADEVERLREIHLRNLRNYLEIEARDFPLGPRSRSQKVRHLVLRAGIENERRRIAFCEDAIAILHTD